MVNGNGERGEVGEIVVSKIRTGMKREFKMMIKAQGGFGMDFGARRVTRSHKESLRTRTGTKIAYNGSLSGRNSLKRLNGKKKKDDVSHEVLEEIKVDDPNLFGSVEANGDGDHEEKVGLVNEEEEMKSDVLDGISDDDGKCMRVENNMEEDANGVMGQELADSNVLMDEDAVGANVGVVPFKKGPVDGISERVNESSTSMEVRNATEASDADFNGMDAMLGLEREVTVMDENDASVTLAPVRRHIRRSKLETLEQNGTEDVKVVVDTDDSAPIRRFTRSMMKASSNALEQSGVEDEKGEVQYDVGSPQSSSMKMELKMSKKVELKKNPSRLKELLETGFLEGQHVTYVKGSKARVSGEAGLSGQICGSGILCFCKDCKGSKAVTPIQFELHAGSGNKRPPEYIYLENGKPLRDILNMCNTVPSDLLEQAIQAAVGPLNSEPVCCLSCKGSIHRNGAYGRILCDSCIAYRKSHAVSPVLSNGSAQNLLHISGDSQPVAAELNRTRKRSLPSAPSARTIKLSSTSHSRSKGHGKVTKKDLRLHKLVFDSDLLPDRTELAYYANGKKMREGFKSGHGIYCRCCHKVVSPSVFESHAGFSARRKPYLHIYTSNGVSLHELSIEIKKDLNTTDESDDVCTICEDMGKLLCCDNCPRSFHKECIDLPNTPQDKWYCRYCEDMFQRKKFVAFNINAVAAGRIAGVDPIEEIKKRCIRIVETLEVNESGCGLCRGSDFSRSGFGPRTVILCDQCEREYHIGCLKEHEVDDLKDLPPEWFCSKECGAMYSALQQLVHDGENMLPDSMLSIIREKHESVFTENKIDLNLTWRILCGKVAGEEHRKWLSGAVSVFHDRFDPIGYSKSSGNDLIPTMIYGRSNDEQDFGGMYCAVLILDSKVVSAGIFRIFGHKLAEIPLVATSSECQGKGYFQSLLGCIEELLASMEVEEIVLPAASEAETLWKNKFGFKNLSDEQLSKYRKEYPVMLFHGTIMLHKSVPKPKTLCEAIDV